MTADPTTATGSSMSRTKPPNFLNSKAMAWRGHRPPWSGLPPPMRSFRKSGHPPVRSGARFRCLTGGPIASAIPRQTWPRCQRRRRCPPPAAPVPVVVPSKIRAPCPMKMMIGMLRASALSALMRLSIRADRASYWPDAGSIEPSGSRRLIRILLEKRDQRRVDLVGALLLDPVAGAVDDELLFQAGQNPLHVSHAFGADQAGDDGILRSGNEQRRLMDLRALPGRGQFPVAVDIAVPVEPATKA